MMPPEYLKLRVLEAVRQRPMPRRQEPSCQNRENDEQTR